MKLSSYVMTVDRGFAPNPFGRYCTLACCKPTIRRHAEVGDVIAGFAGKRFEHAGKLIYAMKVKEVLTFQEYWDDPRFYSRRPTNGTSISQCGDNIWSRVGRKWRLEPNVHHDMGQQARDTSGKHVLVATEFYYFGEAAQPISSELKGLRAKGRGHQNTTDEELIERFWHWLGQIAHQQGRIGEPSDFNGSVCVQNETVCVT